ncbi:imidazole glycerol phosphate synthase subunit HisH [uncultured Albimonas sp.]|uniref:imidazole glycerol phosphate synthase subunit HisH n=1 Tax=uncultured Albimonas sp. TaxID=1331701 RepID=UPI0030EB13FC
MTTAPGTAIVDYGSGNLHSVAKSFERMSREAGAGGPVVVTADAETVRRADRIVLPGVGAFGDCAAGLRAVPGMWEAIEERVAAGTPFLGICVGQQLMADRGLEFGAHSGFGWIAGDVAPIEVDDPALKIPHMGWNPLVIDRPHPLLEGIADGDHAYFVHSFHLTPQDPAARFAHVMHGGPVTAMVARDTMAGTQFHPEKSQATGLRLIANFLAWRP